MNKLHFFLKQSTLIKKILTAGFLFTVAILQVLADGGLVTPNNQISVFEPGQKAIIGWNGEEEVLILSTDVKTSEDTWIVEIIPFPSMPDTPVAGNTESFLTVRELLNKRIKELTNPGDVNSDGYRNIVDALMIAQYAVGIEINGFNPFAADVSGDNKINIIDALKIAQYFVGFGASLETPTHEDLTVTFEEITGVHNITGFHATSASGLIEFARNMLAEKTTVEDMVWGTLENIIEEYITGGIEYWAVDLLNLGSDEKSRDPIIYRFSSNNLFFPLKVSATGSGMTDISVFTITENELEKQDIEASDLEHMNFKSYFELTSDELTQISPTVAGLFGGSAKIAYLNYNGMLEDLSNDLMAGMMPD